MTEARGEVYDLGYQRYDGPREGRARARRAIFENGVRTVLGLGRGPRAKIMPVLLFVGAMAPAFVFVIILSVAGPLAGFLPGPADYYQVVSIIMILFAAIMAPELLCPDRRDNVIHLYLVRPLTPTDYVLGRFLAFFVIVLVLAYSGQIVLQLGLVLTASNPMDYLRDNWLDIPRFLVAGVLFAAFIAVVPLAVAALTTRRAVAAAFVIGLFLITSAVAGGLTEDAHCHDEEGALAPCTPGEGGAVTGDAAKWFALISFGDVPIRVNDMIFDRENESATARAAAELPDVIPIGVYLLFTIGSGFVLWWRYQRIRV
ncbi:MAG: ABC transporter permease [Chloroflexi bacterium]|nr:ABC transporter permease [Chloroflexota bacterium]